MDGVAVTNLLFGAGHENGRRPGTENVLEITGLGAACQYADKEYETTCSHLKTMRDRLHQGLEEILGSESLRLNGHPTQRLPNTLSLCFKKVPGNILLDEINTMVAASAGSACHADQISVSSVLAAMRVPIDWAMGTIRFSVGRFTTTDEIDQAIQIISSAVFKLQKET